MKNKALNAPYVASAPNIGLKVLRIGESPRLQAQAASASDVRMMKGIHTHFTYEIFFITAGSLLLVTDEFSKEYEKSILIIPPQLHHYTLPRTGESYCLLFSIEGTHALAHRLRNLLDTGISHLPISEQICFYIARLAEKCDAQNSAGERDAALLSSLIFNEIFDMLLPNEHPMGEGKQSTHMSEIESYINAHLQKRITLSEVASSVHLSAKQISRIVMRECACTFLELVTKKRLASAEMLLKNSDMRVSEIAAQTFYGSESYFYTLFKKSYGMTPQKYRKAAHCTETIKESESAYEE